MPIDIEGDNLIMTTHLPSLSPSRGISGGIIRYNVGISELVLPAAPLAVPAPPAPAPLAAPAPLLGLGQFGSNCPACSRAPSRHRAAVGTNGPGEEDDHHGSEGVVV